MTSGAAKASEEFGKNTITRCSHCNALYHHHTFSSWPGARVHLCCWLQWPRKAPRMFLSAHRSAQPSTGWSWLGYFSILWWDQRDDLDEYLGERKTNLASLQQGWCGPSPGIDLILMQSAMNSNFKSSKVAVMPLMQSNHWSLMSSYQNLLIITVMPLMQSD